MFFKLDAGAGHSNGKEILRRLDAIERQQFIMRGQLLEALQTLAQLERKVDKLVDALPGPAARITMIAGPETEQP